MRSSRWPLRVMGMLCGLLVVGCDARAGGSGVTPDTDAAVGNDAAVGTDAATGGDVAVSTDGAPGGDVVSGPDAQAMDVVTAVDAVIADRVTPQDAATFANARPITLPMLNVTQNLGSATALQHFSFTLNAGDWLAIAATPGTDAAEFIDPVITLFDESGRQIAQNDDSLPRVDRGSGLRVRIAVAGTYYLRVQDFATWSPMPGQTPPTQLDYQLSAGVMDPALFPRDTANDSASTAAPLVLRPIPNSTRFYSLVAGLADSPTDLDVYSFDVSSLRNVSLFLQPGGTTGSGSTAIPGRVWVTDATGATIIARISTAAVSEISPSLPAGSYRLWVEPPATALGANPFYVGYAQFFDENPVEAREVANNLAATPEPLVPQADGWSFILATLGNGDVDYFSFSVAAGQVVDYVCASRTLGSGVQGLAVSVTNSIGSVLATGSSVENDTEAATRINAAVTGAGTYLLRLAKSGQDPQVTGNWVRCGIHPHAPTP